MSKLTDFIKLITGRFDNKEQFDKMQAEGKTYPYAKHINTACNDKIKKSPRKLQGYICCRRKLLRNRWKKPRITTSFSYFRK